MISTRATRRAFLLPRSSSSSCSRGGRSRASPPSTSHRRLPPSSTSSSASSSSSYLSETMESVVPSGGGDGVTRPFRVLGLQQVALGSLIKSDMTRLWIEIFGLSRVGSYRNVNENVDEDILILGKCDSPHVVEFDLMVPINPNASPRVHSPPLNHIGLWIDDLEAAVCWMEDRGVRFAPGGVSSEMRCIIRARGRVRVCLSSFLYRTSLDGTTRVR